MRALPLLFATGILSACAGDSPTGPSPGEPRYAVTVSNQLTIQGEEPAPGTGLTGACNMSLAGGVGAMGGMAHAMSVDDPQGNEGMFRAIERSGC